MPLRHSKIRNSTTRSINPSSANSRGSYKMETIILHFICPCNMERYSFEVLHQLFNTTQLYEDYFPILRGDAYKMEYVMFGFQELACRTCDIILEVETRILYELLTTKLLTKTECLERGQSNKIIMSNGEVVDRLWKYWRDKCVEKASLASGATEYWTLLNDKSTINDIEDQLEAQMYSNSPHFIDDSSKILNADGQLDSVYKTSSIKQEISNTCISCNTIISPRCYFCDFSIDPTDDNDTLEPAKGYSCHRYAVNSGLFTDYYLFKISIINKGTQLNRLKNTLKGVVVTEQGQVMGNMIPKETRFRQMYQAKNYVILDADLIDKQPSKLPNWTMETLNRHKKTATRSRKRWSAVLDADDENDDADNATVTTTRARFNHPPLLDLSELTQNLFGNNSTCLEQGKEQ